MVRGDELEVEPSRSRVTQVILHGSDNRVEFARAFGFVRWDDYLEALKHEGPRILERLKEGQ